LSNPYKAWAQGKIFSAQKLFLYQRYLTVKNNKKILELLHLPKVPNGKYSIKDLPLGTFGKK